MSELSKITGVGVPICDISGKWGGNISQVELRKAIVGLL